MKIDAVGLLCPEPIMMLHKAIQEISYGDKVELYATDPSTERDIDRFCNLSCFCKANFIFPFFGIMNILIAWSYIKITQNNHLWMLF